MFCEQPLRMRRGFAAMASYVCSFTFLRVRRWSQVGEATERISIDEVNSDGSCNSQSWHGSFTKQIVVKTLNGHSGMTTILRAGSSILALTVVPPVTFLKKKKPSFSNAKMSMYVAVLSARSVMWSLTRVWRLLPRCWTNFTNFDSTVQTLVSQHSSLKRTVDQVMPRSRARLDLHDEEFVAQRRLLEQLENEVFEIWKERLAVGVGARTFAPRLALSRWQRGVRKQFWFVDGTGQSTTWLPMRWWRCCHGPSAIKFRIRAPYAVSP